jgi:hypothetical protein
MQCLASLANKADLYFTNEFVSMSLGEKNPLHILMITFHKFHFSTKIMHAFLVIMTNYSHDFPHAETNVRIIAASSCVFSSASVMNCSTIQHYIISDTDSTENIQMFILSLLGYPTNITWNVHKMRFLFI